ncbi:helix-turn-helix domain-containing protein [Dactylosporangium sp. CA-092794]|uniref:TetR/AcrR family transcriptional regulator n=1 Tax=Dactylosporangium sp. CA-092794 TaxID=3239929 RepID=UPI003D926E32
MKTADRRTRGRQRRRDALYATAVDLFVERGFDSTTMDDIAERADVARATVFNHFPRKAAFLDEWATRRRKRASAAAHADDLEGAPLRNVLTRYFTELCQISQTSAASRLETVALMSAAVHSINVLARSELVTEISQFVDRARARGEIAARIAPMRVGRLLVASYVAVLTAWISAEPAPFDLAEEMVATLDLQLRGIMPPPGPPQR